MVRQNGLEVQHLALLLSLAVMRAISWWGTPIFTVTLDHYGVQTRIVLEVCEILCVRRSLFALIRTLRIIVSVLVNLHKHDKCLNSVMSFVSYPSEDSEVNILQLVSLFCSNI